MNTSGSIDIRLTIIMPVIKYARLALEDRQPFVLWGRTAHHASKRTSNDSWSAAPSKHCHDTWLDLHILHWTLFRPDQLYGWSWSSTGVLSHEATLFYRYPTSKQGIPGVFLATSQQPIWVQSFDMWSQVYQVSVIQSSIELIDCNLPSLVVGFKYVRGFPKH